MTGKYFLFFGLVCLLTNCAEKTMIHPSLDIQGHRGCRGLIPENTIEGFLYAVDLGVHTLEMDVVVSKDSQIVVSHEPFFNHEISTAPDGSLITTENELTFNIFEMDLEKIQSFDVGLKVHPRFPLQKKIKTFKPTLKQVIDTIEDYTATKGLPSLAYNVEIKRVPQYDHVYHPDATTFANLLIKEIYNAGIQEKTIIQSFDIESLQAVKKLAPDLQLALLVEETIPFERKISNLGFQPEIYSPHFKLVSPQLLEYCRNEGIRLIPWTVNEDKDIEMLIRKGVDGIISDFPDRVIEIYSSLK